METQTERAEPLSALLTAALLVWACAAASLILFAAMLPGGFNTEDVPEPEAWTLVAAFAAFLWRLA